MPIIPLPQRTNPLPDIPKPVLDRERRPTVDNSGVIAGVANLAKAGKMPDLPMSLAENSGFQAIGKALGQAGSVMGALAIKMKEAQSDKQIADWDTKMEATRAEFEAWKMKNPDPAIWGEEWQKRLGQMKTEFGEDQKLNFGAREQIGLRLTRYEGVSSADVLKESAKETFRQARSASDARIMRYTETQDEAAFQEELKNRREKGYSYPHEDEADEIRFTRVGEQKQKEAKAEAERTEYEAEASIAIADPNKWLADNKTPWEGKQILWQRVKNAADARKNEGTAEVINDLQQDIITGNITWPTEVDALESPFLTPELRENAKRYLSERNEYQERQDRETNGVRNAVELRKRVAAYDPTQDPDRTEYFGLVREIGTRVEQSMAGEITGELYKKYGTQPPELKVRPEIQRNVSKTLDVIFDPKVGAVPWRKEVPVLDSKGKPVKDYNGNPKTEIQEDQAAKQKAIDAQTIIESKMADWFKENPGATLPEVRKKVNELLPEGTEGAFFMNMKKASGASAQLRGFVPADDLQDKLPAGLKAHAQDFIDAARENGLNPRVLAAIAALETAGGTSKAFREKNNAMGISDDKGPIALSSVRDSIFRQARTLAREDGPYAKATTLDEVGRIYAPPGAGNDFHGTNGGWSKNVSAWLAKL